jgi:hypothetical protein
VLDSRCCLQRGRPSNGLTLKPNVGGGGHAVGSDRDYRTTTAGSRHAGHPDADIAASLGRYNGLSSLPPEFQHTRPGAPPRIIVPRRALHGELAAVDGRRRRIVTEGTSK